MNSKYEGIALELTKIYADKCQGISEERVIEVYNNYLDILLKKKNSEEELEELRNNSGKYDILIENIKRLLQTDKNFIYTNDLLEMINILEEE